MHGGFLRRPNGTTPLAHVVEFVGAILKGGPGEGRPLLIRDRPVGQRFGRCPQAFANIARQRLKTHSPRAQRLFKAKEGWSERIRSMNTESRAPSI